jgi:hypothetical protein
VASDDGERSGARRVDEGLHHGDGENPVAGERIEERDEVGVSRCFVEVWSEGNDPASDRECPFVVALRLGQEVGEEDLVPYREQVEDANEQREAEDGGRELPLRKPRSSQRRKEPRSLPLAGHASCVCGWRSRAGSFGSRRRIGRQSPTESTSCQLQEIVAVSPDGRSGAS